MKSSSGLRIAVVSTLCVQPFLMSACTNDEVDFYTASGAGSAPLAGSAGRDSASGGSAQAGMGAVVDAGGSAGEADDAGAGGIGDSAGADNGGTGNGGTGNGGGAGGNAGRGGTAGRGGMGGMSGGGSGGGAGRGGNGAGGASGASAGAGGSSVGGSGTAGASTGGSGGRAGSGGIGGANAGSGGTAGGAVCGNAVLEKGEQCDDGNIASLDACSASCAFEQSQRANTVELKFKTTSFCPKNAFGEAFEGTAQTALQAILDQRIANGSLSLLFAFRGLKDLTGTSAETITLGMAYGAPSAGSGYDGKKDLDWWYSPATGQVDSAGQLYSSSVGTLADGVLDASPDSLRIPLFSDLAIYLSSVKLRLSVGDSSAPLASSGLTPGHLASEHVRAALVSFASAGPTVPANIDPGQLCGGMSAASLSAIAIPAAYAIGGTSPCTEGYSASRSLLDLLVGGCKVGPDELVARTQPDQVDPGLPPVGHGGPYSLVADPTTKAVTGCKDATSQGVTLSACLNAAAYSAAFRVKAGRVIIK